jgi:hypothetical protein
VTQKLSSKSKNEGDKLATGIMVAIILVSLIVVAMMALFVINKRRARDGNGSATTNGAGQNAPKDQSEALNIDMDGGALREAVRSMTSGKSSSHTDLFDFEAVNGLSVEVDEEGNQQPQFETFDTPFDTSSESKTNGGGHGRII